MSIPSITGYIPAPMNNSTTANIMCSPEVEVDSIESTKLGSMIYTYSGIRDTAISLDIVCADYFSVIFEIFEGAELAATHQISESGIYHLTFPQPQENVTISVYVKKEDANDANPIIRSASIDIY